MRAADAFARLPTGIKMLVFLSLAFLPLGLISGIVSTESARTNRLTRDAETRIVAADAARQINAAIIRGGTALQGVGATMPLDPARCGVQLDSRLAAEPYPTALALFGARGRLICATQGFSGLPAESPERRIGTEVFLNADPAMLRYVVLLPEGRFGVGEIPLASLSGLVRSPAGRTAMGSTLVQGTATMPLAQLSAGALDQRISATVPVAGNQLALEVQATASPVTAIEALMILLPILMWIAAALIGWLVVDGLLVKPLGSMQAAIVAYGAGARPMTVPRMSTPSTEISALGEAFVNVTRKVELHEAEIEAALSRQTRLTREVHHRVKNNLQVVASLINLHARGAEDPAVAAAYASIQRRVDALSVVHRNHYAELEENRGVGLRALIGELASNLRATAPPEASRLSIQLDVMPAYTNQDVAVPVAFLITEIVELVMNCAPDALVSIILAPAAAPDRALLTIQSPALTGDACRNDPTFTRFGRILEGLSRQLRAKLAIDEEAGSYAIEISIVSEPTV